MSNSNDLFDEEINKLDFIINLFDLYNKNELDLNNLTLPTPFVSTLKETLPTIQSNFNSCKDPSQAREFLIEQIGKLINVAEQEKEMDEKINQNYR